ncbi:MAG: DNA-directed RNA polymerase subunit beta [Bacillaceae bacterium]|nr:DNA-directed RNA polymerase subunit beta [Bacillaceae bacterium]
MEGLKAQKATLSRSEKREARREKREKKKKIRIRLFPIWLRILIVLFLIVVCFFIGAMIGYGVIGDGNPFDVFKKSTWTHIYDIVNKESPD